MFISQLSLRLKALQCHLFVHQLLENPHETSCDDSAAAYSTCFRTSHFIVNGKKY